MYVTYIAASQIITLVTVEAFSLARRSTLCLPKRDRQYFGRKIDKLKKTFEF